MKQRLFLTMFFALALALLAQAQFPSFPIYKVQLGFQTTADGLVYRNAGAPAYTPATDRDAWMYLDTVAGALYYYQAGWNEIETGGGADSALYVTITRLVDSLDALRATLATKAELGDTAQAIRDDFPAAAPAGTDAQTLRYSGTTLVVDNLVKNTGTELSINPTNNTVPFVINRSGIPVLSFLPISGGGTSGQLILRGQTISANRGLAVYNYSNSATAGAFGQFFRARGTYASPAVVSNNDEIGAFNFRALIIASPEIYSTNITKFGAVVNDLTGNGYASMYFQASGPSWLNKPQLLVHPTGFVGVGDFGTLSALTAPARHLHVNGEVRITDLTTDTPTRIVGADADGDLAAIEVGTGLDLTAGVLTATGGAPDSALYVTITHLIDSLEQLRIDLASLQALEDSAAAIRADFPSPGGGGGYNAGVGTSLVINNSSATTNLVDLSLPAGTLANDGEAFSITMPCLALNTTGATRFGTFRAVVDGVTVYDWRTFNIVNTTVTTPHVWDATVFRTSATSGIMNIRYGIASNADPTVGYGRTNTNASNTDVISIAFTCDWSTTVDIDFTISLDLASPNFTFTRLAWNARK